jgi:Ca2+-binding EF-hand superfamily protein
MHSRAKVNTPIEKKYDANGDGWLQPDEVREMLKDKQAIIKTHGKAKVDTELEARYDANGDGIIDANEAKAMAGDLK